MHIGFVFYHTADINLGSQSLTKITLKVSNNGSRAQLREHFQKILIIIISTTTLSHGILECFMITMLVLLKLRQENNSIVFLDAGCVT